MRYQFTSFLIKFIFLLYVGIILKMARLTKDGSFRGQSKPPSKTFIIPATELVQVIAKVLLYFLSGFGYFNSVILLSDFNAEKLI